MFVEVLTERTLRMPNLYIPPTEVISPKRQWTLVSVLYDRGENNAAVAVGRWEGDAVLAIRWNGNDDNPIGNPQSRGLPTWFIVPQEFNDSILKTLKEVEPEKAARAQEFFVESVVLTNTIAIPERRKAIQEAVLEGIGKRSRGGLTVRIFEPALSPEYVVKIAGPNGFNWERSFLGHEETPEFIREEVRKATLGT